jgi:hypothetical protein
MISPQSEMKNIFSISRVRRSLQGLRFRARKNVVHNLSSSAYEDLPTATRKNVVHSISSCAYEDLSTAPKDECHADLHEVQTHELEARIGVDGLGASALPAVSGDKGFAEHPATDTSHVDVFEYPSNAGILTMDASKEVLEDRNDAGPPATNDFFDDGPPDIYFNEYRAVNDIPGPIPGHAEHPATSDFFADCPPDHLYHDYRAVNDILDDSPENNIFDEHPAADTFYNVTIAQWPAITCSELASKRIRLVKIVSGAPGSTIECEVNTCFLDRTPSYAAISYTWGSSLGFREVLIEGQPRSVPKNLWRFLDQARRLPNSRRLTRWLWIDALSIDQSNPQEKLDQVGIISSIFRKAERVVVWLGPSYGNSDRALTAMHPDNTTRSRREPKTLAGPVWAGVHGICERPYWHRLWVYQELKSARFAELMCGNRLVPLRTFHDYLFDFSANRLEDKFEVLRKSSAGMMLKMTNNRSRGSLRSLIRKTSHLRCVDPRDKAYAVLSIARTWKQRIKIPADYTITVPVLLNRILAEACIQYPPTNLHQAAKECMELERLFGEPTNSIFVIDDLVRFSQHKSPLAQLACDGKHPDLKLQQLLTTWCVAYSHSSIKQLVAPPRNSRGTTRN